MKIYRTKAVELLAEKLITKNLFKSFLLSYGIKKQVAFTLAEVLIVLAVIGVIAAMSLPSLISNIEDNKFTSARERAVYNIREAVRSMSSNNGGLNGIGDSIKFRDLLATYLSVSKSCDAASDCFHSDSTTLKGIDGSSLGAGVLQTSSIASHPTQIAYTNPLGAAVGLILNNGTTMNIVFNTHCNENTITYINTNNRSQNHVCANVVFDTNGFVAPNQVGKDIGFATVINPINTVVIGIIPAENDENNGLYMHWNNAQAACTAKGGTWHLSSKDELSSLFYNNNMLGASIPAKLADLHYWTSSEYAPDRQNAYYMAIDTGVQGIDLLSPAIYPIRCVKR